MSRSHYKKRPISPSNMQPVIASSTTSNAERQPLFLPDPDEEHGPSISTTAPLFLLEEVERERPRKKKRRISSKAMQSKTLDDLWHPRQVCGKSLIAYQCTNFQRRYNHMFSKIQAHLLLAHQIHNQSLLPYLKDPRSVPFRVYWVKNLVCFGLPFVHVWWLR